MTDPRNKTILEILSEYKWGDEFTCSKCGGHKYRVDKQTFSRTCTTVKDCREESVIKSTALEGLRFPVEKAYDMVAYLVDKTKFGYDEKNIFITQLSPQKQLDVPDDSIIGSTNIGMAVSMNQILAMEAAGEMSKSSANEFLASFWKDNLPTIADMERHFEVEANTVSKFIDRIDSRIPLDEDDKHNSSMERVIDYLLTYKPDMDHILGMLMIPLDKKWNHGKAIIDGKLHVIRKPLPDSDVESVRWRIAEITRLP